MCEIVTTTEIDISALLSNFDNIRKKVSPVKVLAVVKENAYGHGITEVSKALEKRKTDYFGVNNLSEGLTLRKAGISTPILMLMPVLGNDIDKAVENALEMTVISEKTAEEVSEISLKLGKKGKIHIKLDTGMGRIGINWEIASGEIEKIVKKPNLEVIGLFAHFATSDEKDKRFANLQLERFNRVVEDLKEKNIEIPLKHTANSGAVLDMEGSYYDMVRIGIMLYGYYPSNETSKNIQLEPVMTLKSKVIQKKRVKKGTSISYCRTFITERDTNIVTIPIGYADGYRRALSNQGEVLIHGNRYPIAGNVCMNWIMADVKDDNVISEGDEVVLFGKQGDEYLDLQEICDKLNTINYEILTQISSGVPRVYVNK